ncbi:MAG TPA: methyl-accepting chemotaxis protein [Rhodocyclaceae bacterium]|nr:methyl-accepting chemotaxis protein [Rhodocyclaceae bacterium]
MNILQRILLAPVVAIVLLLVFGIVAYSAISTQNAALEDISNTRFDRYKVSTGLAGRLAHSHNTMFRLVSWYTVYDKATQARLLDEVPKGIAAVAADLDKWSGDPGLGEQEKAQIKTIQGILSKYQKDVASALDFLTIDVTSALGNMKAAEDTFQKLKEAFDTLNAQEAELVNTRYLEAKAASGRALSINLLVLVVAIGVASAMATATARNLLAQLGGEPSYAVEIANRIAKGDLSVQVAEAKPGSILAAMGAMRDSLRTTIGKMRTDAEQLSGAAVQLSSAAKSVASSSSQQSASAIDMAAAVEELTSSINTVADNAHGAASITRESGETAKQGAEIIVRAAEEMEKISGSVQAAAGTITELGNQADQISSIVTVINDVADQTNLLALNAAIEAARAGEAGRGFAVVADEVRKLAERTAKSTHDIREMISSIQDRARNAVATMESAVVQVNEGGALAHEANEAIGRISTASAQVAEAVNNISDALHEQGKVTDQLAGNVERIARMSEENSRNSSDSAGSARHLENLAGEMRQAVTRFRV